MRKNNLEKFKSYLIDQELSENTIQSYLFSMNQFFSRYETATKENALQWKNELQTSGLSPKTVNVRLNGYNKFVTMEGRERDAVKTLKLHSATAVTFSRELSGKKTAPMRDYKLFVGQYVKQGGLVKNAAD